MRTTIRNSKGRFAKGTESPKYWLGKKQPTRTPEHCKNLSESLKKSYANNPESKEKIMKNLVRGYYKGKRMSFKVRAKRCRVEGVWRSPKKRPEEQKIWSKKILRRDNFSCQICHQVGGTLNAHHIKSYTKYPDFRTDLDNGITLCDYCHKWVHSIKPKNCLSMQ
jgi:hypothetical protein